MYHPSSRLLKTDTHPNTNTNTNTNQITPPLQDGNESEDSYDSGGEQARTKEDDMFLDLDDDDEDMVKEYNEKQSFEKEEGAGRKKKKRKERDGEERGKKVRRRAQKISKYRSNKRGRRARSAQAGELLSLRSSRLAVLRVRPEYNTSSADVRLFRRPPTTS